MATKPTHTPGPRIHLGCRGDCKEYPMEDWCPGCLERYTAWQRLIAAAPDLLEAARGALETMDEFLIDGQSIGVASKKLRAAIAKAEGREAR